MITFDAPDVPWFGGTKNVHEIIKLCSEKGCDAILRVQILHSVPHFVFHELVVD